LLTKCVNLDYHSVFTTSTGLLSDFFLVINIQGTAFLVILLIILVLFSFVISGAEVALFSLGNKDVNMLKTKQHASARRIVDLLSESKEVYTSLLIAGTFINISIIVLSNFLINELFHLSEFLVGLKSFAFISELLIKVVIIAFIIIFFCKVLPKVWATQNNLRFAYGCSNLVQGIHFLLIRFSRRMVRIAELIARKIGADRGFRTSMQELDEAIEFTAGEESSEEEKNILKGIVKFGNISVKQIMRSRLDVSGLDYKLGYSQLQHVIENLHYSRMPVYKNNLDHITGIIHTKDLLPFLNESEDFDWHKLVRQPYFVPETKLIEDLLRDFQQKRIHFAIVVDEFGGTSGIVTMEDIIEEIIGDIRDEFDEEETGIKKLDNDNYIFSGKVMINDACKAMNISPDTFDSVRGESESIAGLMLELAGELPPPNTVIPCGDFNFTVLEAFRNRINQVKVSIKPRETPPS